MERAGSDLLDRFGSLRQGEADEERKQRILNTLYKRKKATALRRAAENTGGESPGRCLICHRLVCEHCFLICEKPDLCRLWRVCRNRTAAGEAERLKKTGFKKS